jgi:acyl dehydratase
VSDAIGVTVGDELAPTARLITREDVRAYAEASGDRNPLHLDDDAARAAGFPAVIAHGMFTMGHLAACVVAWCGAPERVLEMSAQFRAPVAMGETIVAGGRVVQVDTDAGTATLETWVTVDRDGTTEHAVRKGRAVVRLG